MQTNGRYRRGTPIPVTTSSNQAFKSDLPRQREINRLSQKEIVEVVTFVKRLFPKKQVKDGDWQVVIVKSVEHNDTFTVVGKMVAMTDEYDTTYKVGCKLDFSDRMNAWQYNVYYSQEIYEFKTDEDVKVFLGHFLTPIQLANMLDVYPKPIEILEEGDINKLLQIKNIGIKTAERILKRYDACKDKGSAYVELGKFGISTTIIDKLVKRYASPDIAVSVVKENPYILANEVRGIGFKKADELALKSGVVGTNSVMRGVAFIKYYFRECAERGDSYIDFEELLDAIDENLGEYSDDSIDMAMCELKANGELWSQDYEDFTLVAHTHYYNVEKEICRHIKRLMSYPSNVRLNREEAMERIKIKEQAQGWEYTERQLEGIFATMENNVTIITGYGGTGKTSAVAGMLACTDEGYDFKQCALSGKASANLTDITGVEGTTIHSLLRYDSISGKFMHNIAVPLETDLIILDEGSMVDVELFLALLEAIPNGAKLIILGDINQLEAIGAGNVLMDLIDSETIPVVVFDKVHRQGAKSAIKTESVKVAKGRQLVDGKWIGDTVLGELKDLKYIGFNQPYQSEKPRPTIDLAMTEFKKLFQEAKDVANISVIAPTKSNGTSCHALNLLIQDYVLPPKRGRYVELGTESEPFNVYIGDKVINLKNNRHAYTYVVEDGETKKVPRQIFNGNMGEVTDIIDDDTIVVDFYNIGEVIIDAKQLEHIALGYAITIHKAQGSTIPYVVGVLDYTHYSMLNRQLVYTLMSRAKTKMSFVFESKALAKAISTNYVTKKRTFLYHMLIGEIE